MKKENNIKCPHCDKVIDISEAYVHQIENTMRSDMQKEYNDKLLKYKQNFEKDAMDSAKIVIEKDYNHQLSLQKKEIEGLVETLKERTQDASEYEKLKRKVELMDSENDLKTQRLLSAKENDLTKILNDKYELREKELQKKLDDQEKSAHEQLRKLQQGSVQLQGEVQELAIESWLKDQFPSDNIIEIKKGQKGADCLQEVYNKSGNICGSIYYESKRAQKFGANWIEKFKDDMRERKADVGILVTSVYPKGIDKCTANGNLYICSFSEFKLISDLIREQLLKVYTARGYQQNRQENQSMIYKYLTSSDFQMAFQTIVEQCVLQQRQLEKEKIALVKMQAVREKSIYTQLHNLAEVYGSFSGLAGPGEVKRIEQLNLPDQEEEV